MMYQYKKAITGWRKSRVVSLATITTMLIATGCRSQNDDGEGVPSKTPGVTPTSSIATTAESEESIRLKNQLYDLRVENKKLSNLVTTLRNQKATEEKVSPNGIASEKTQLAVATAEVGAKAKLEELQKKFDELLTEMKKDGTQPPLRLTDDDVKQIVDAVRAHGGPDDQGTIEKATTEVKKSDSANAEANETLKMLAKGVGLALCAAQPELCPFLAPIFEALNLFGSTEERKTFLEAVGNFADGDPLTDDQKAVVKKAADEGYSKLREGARKLIDGIGDTNPDVQLALKAGEQKLMDTVGITKPAFDELKQVLESNVTVEVKLAKVQATFPVFPNPDVRTIIADLADDLGGKQLGNDVRKLEVR